MCGIVGIAGHRNAAQLAYLGLFALQHRGQESAGIATRSGSELDLEVGMGLASQVFTPERLGRLPGSAALGHVRYATTGASHLKNAQPLLFKHSRGPIAISHNGNLTNALGLREKLEGRGAIFQSTTDSEVIIHLIARQKGPTEDAIIESLKQVEGAYSLLFLTPEKLVAVRDPLGFRPLVLGKLGRAFVFASETCALNLLRASFVREIEPGEMVVVENGTLKSLKPFLPRPRRAACIFEQVYFARPDSRIFGLSVHKSRRAFGAELAREMKAVQADIVVPVPDSGMQAALGFSEASGIPFEMGFIRSHYVGRTFIQPLQALRERSAELKLSPIREVIRGRRVILVDDSIVRATTARRIVRMLRRAGAKTVYMAVSSPPIVSPCYYGIDTPRTRELIAANHTLEEIRQHLRADSLHYLSVEGMLRAVGRSQGFCTACFTRNYPTPIPDAARLDGGCAPASSPPPSVAIPA